MVGRSEKRMEKINILDLFSGIGGFALGVEQAGVKTGYVGFSDIDKYANQVYKRRFPNAEQLGSVTDVSYKKLKGQRIDLLTGGFPCQSFSISGRRLGFEDTRGTLFFEIARILKDYIANGKPIPCILLENVKGVLSHDNRRTFATIYKVLADLNYTLECQLVNTKWWLPQNRERIFIFGRYNGSPSGRKVFPIYGESRKTNKVSRQKPYTNTISARYEGQGNGSYVVENKPKGKLKVSISNASKREFGWKDRSPALLSRDYKDPKLVRVHSTQTRNPNRPSLTRKCDCGSQKLYSKCCGASGGSGHLSKNDGTSYCLDTGNTQAVETESRIRKLTPNECLRLQGFPDNWNDCCSDTQRYKQAGNAVSVPVIKSIVEKIYDL